MGANLQQLQASWDELGKDDPFWAILAVPGSKGNRWDLDEFFASGRDTVGSMLEFARGCGAEPARTAALDFGCGAGRLTQGMAAHFDRVDGVDIAASMVELARGHNQHGERCQYHVNGKPDLRLFDDASFDFVGSHMVLQHMAPELAESYLREFIRVLRPGGVAVFQAPAEPAPTWKGRLLRALNAAPLQPLLTLYRRLRDGRTSVAEMHGVPRARVEELMVQSGAEVCGVTENRSAGPTWVSYRYCVRRVATTSSE